jgi:hypothetical protein
MSQREEEVAAVRAAADDGDLVTFKDYLSEPRFRIRLDDQVNAAVRAALTQMSSEKFPLSTTPATGEDFVARLAAYEEEVRPLQAKAALLGKWATPEQMLTLSNMLARLCDGCAETAGGDCLWRSMRWYPVSLLMYSASIAALSAENYRAFAAIHTKKITARTRRVGRTSVSIITPVIEAMAEVSESNGWRCVEQYRRNRTPESEHLFGVLRPVLDDLLFLGASYEHLFDRYEILRALLYADTNDRARGPIGRFGWKYTGGGQNNPYSELRAEAQQQQDAWGPVQAGLFHGSYTRFEETASKFESELLSKLGWY